MRESILAAKIATWIMDDRQVDRECHGIASQFAQDRILAAFGWITRVYIKDE